MIGATAEGATILFTDIEDSSVLVESLGDRRWLDLLRLHNAVIREQIAQQRGFEVKTVGDGFMVAFTTPAAAVACAAGIQRALATFNAGSGAPPLRVRIGLHAGPMLREADDFFGREVVIAARVSAAAHGGEVLLSDAVAQVVGEGAHLGPPRVRTLKGLHGRHRLHPLVWDEGAAAAPAPAARLHERAEPLRVLADVLAGADDRGRTVALMGPAGIGKSALLSSVVERARDRGVRVLRAQGFEIEQAFPFGVVRELLSETARRMDPTARAELAGPAALRALGLADAEASAVPDEDVRLSVMTGLLRLIAGMADDSPTVLVVDDAQWVDDASLEWLGFASRRIADRRLVLLLGVRDDDDADPAVLRTIVEDPSVTRVRLAPLTADGVERVVRERHPEASDAYVAAAFRASRGVPVYLHELLGAAAAEGLPHDDDGARRLAEVTSASVQRLVLSRLEALGPGELALARACAALDVRADLQAAGTLAGLSPPDALAAADALCAARLLVPRRPLQFAHPLMRSAVTGAMSLSARSALHAAAAGLLRGEGAPAQEVGAHLLAVVPGTAPGFVDYLREAAEAALADGAPAAAVRFLERALDEPEAAAQRGALLLLLARTKLRTGDAPTAISLAETALGMETRPADRGAALTVLAVAVQAEMLRPAGRADWDRDGRRVIEMIHATTPGLEENDRALRFELEALAVDMATTHASMRSLPMAADAVTRLERVVEGATDATAGERALSRISPAFGSSPRRLRSAR